MRLVETPVFSRKIDALLSPEDYRSLQLALVLRPEWGALIRGSGGIRKVRWNRPGMGRRGGCRILYFWHKSEDVIYMLYAFAKSEQDDLSREQIRALRRVVEEEFG